MSPPYRYIIAATRNNKVKGTVLGFENYHWALPVGSAPVANRIVKKTITIFSTRASRYTVSFYSTSLHSTPQIQTHKWSELPLRSYTVLDLKLLRRTMWIAWENFCIYIMCARLNLLSSHEWKTDKPNSWDRGNNPVVINSSCRVSDEMCILRYSRCDSKQMLSPRPASCPR